MLNILKELKVFEGCFFPFWHIVFKKRWDPLLQADVCAWKPVNVHQGLCRTGCFRRSSLIPETMGIWFSMWKRTRWPTLRNTWSRVRTCSHRKHRPRGLKYWNQLPFSSPRAFKPQTPHPYLSVGIDQQQVPHGGSLHPTEDVLTGGRAALSDQEIPTAGEKWLGLLSPYPGVYASRQTHSSWQLTDGVKLRGCWLYPPAVEPDLLPDQVLDQRLRERSALLSADLRSPWVEWRHNAGRIKQRRSWLQGFGCHCILCLVDLVFFYSNARFSSEVGPSFMGPCQGFHIRLSKCGSN